jgi:hypothetical protein
MIPCVWCGEAVDTRRAGALRRIIGWQENRVGGGANKIMFRQEVGVWAHKHCAEHHKGELSLTHEVPKLFE